MNIQSQYLILLLSTFIVSSAYGDDNPFIFDSESSYYGIFVDVGKSKNQFTDVDGFANWQEPNSRTDYDDKGIGVGLLWGKPAIFNTPGLNLEIDGALTNFSSDTNLLDPAGLDETAQTKVNWTGSVRIVVEKMYGPSSLFVTGGIAVAGIKNSVTDIDFNSLVVPSIPPHVDADDSFVNSEVVMGYVIGAGVSKMFKNNHWKLRVEGLYYDFGKQENLVNLSGNDFPNRPVRYNVDNTLTIMRLVFIRNF